jgi:hypothetical protein
MTGSERLERARGRRQALRTAMMGLEAASAAPVAREGWLEDVGSALANLAGVFEDHVGMVEGEEGLLEEIEETAPQLQSEMDQMRIDHRAIHALLDNIKTSVKDAPTTPHGPGVIRHHVRSLLTSLAEHRQRGADLVYDAYNVDISVGD